MEKGIFYTLAALLCAALPLHLVQALQPSRNQLCPTELFCMADEMQKTISCDYSKPELLLHPVWSANGTKVSTDFVSTTTFNSTHHSSLLNYSTFDPGQYNINFDYKRLVNPLKSICREIVPNYRTTVSIEEEVCPEDPSEGRVLSRRSKLMVTKVFRNYIARLQVTQHVELEFEDTTS